MRLIAIGTPQHSMDQVKTTPQPNFNWDEARKENPIVAALEVSAFLYPRLSSDVVAVVRSVTILLQTSQDVLVSAFAALRHTLLPGMHLSVYP